MNSREIKHSGVPDLRSEARFRWRPAKEGGGAAGSRAGCRWKLTTPARSTGGSCNADGALGSPAERGVPFTPLQSCGLTQLSLGPLSKVHRSLPVLRRRPFRWQTQAAEVSAGLQDGTLFLRDPGWRHRRLGAEERSASVGTRMVPNKPQTHLGPVILLPWGGASRDEVTKLVPTKNC